MNTIEEIDVVLKKAQLEINSILQSKKPEPITERRVIQLLREYAPDSYKKPLLDDEKAILHDVLIILKPYLERAK